MGQNSRPKKVPAQKGPKKNRTHKTSAAAAAAAARRYVVADRDGKIIWGFDLSLLEAKRLKSLVAAKRLSRTVQIDPMPKSFHSKAVAEAEKRGRALLEALPQKRQRTAGPVRKTPYRDPRLSAAERARAGVTHPGMDEQEDDEYAPDLGAAELEPQDTGDDADDFEEIDDGDGEGDELEAEDEAGDELDRMIAADSAELAAAPPADSNGKAPAPRRETPL